MPEALVAKLKITHVRIDPSHRRTAAVPLLAPSWYDPCKRVIDLVVAAVLLVLAAPLLLVVAAVVKLTSRGPVLYSQERVGRGGRVYRLYKVRSMNHDCEKASGPKWATADDPRVTPVGRFLRTTHLDELPQLWNVLVGDMSLIGPRPERPVFVQQLERLIPHYSSRLNVRPGISGLAQMRLPADSNVEGVRRKVAYDLYYIRCFGPWLDLRILFSTVRYAGRTYLECLTRLLALPGSEQVERAYAELLACGDTLPVPHPGDSIPEAWAEPAPETPFPAPVLAFRSGCRPAAAIRQA